MHDAYLKIIFINGNLGCWDALVKNEFITSKTDALNIED